MATAQSGFVQDLMEKIVSKPSIATLTVGTSILILMLFIQELSLIWPEMTYFRFLVPFIPPFFITRTAKRINQSRAEYDFIKDAEPYIFVAFPKDVSVQSLLNTQASMFSDSATRHFNCSSDELSKLEALPSLFFENPKEREKIAAQLNESYQKNNGHGILQNFQTAIKGKNQNSSSEYILNSVLKTHEGTLKWQATLIKSVK